VKAQLSLNGFGEPREVVPVTVAKLAFLATQDDIDIKEAAERLVAMRVIRVGREPRLLAFAGDDGDDARKTACGNKTVPDGRQMPQLAEERN
jgi:hypothetical protein